MSAWDYEGSPYLLGAPNAHRIASGRQCAEWLHEREARELGRPVDHASGSEQLLEEPAPVEAGKHSGRESSSAPDGRGPR